MIRVEQVIALSWNTSSSYPVVMSLSILSSVDQYSTITLQYILYDHYYSNDVYSDKY